MKKLLFAIICLGLVFGSVSAVPAEEAKDNKIILKIDDKKAQVFGKTVENDVAPIIRNNRTMVASRFISENLGAKVEWKSDTNEVEITKDKVTIVLTINSEKVIVNGKEDKLDSPAFIENDRIYTPARIICENLGADVGWDQEIKTITITLKTPEAKDPEQDTKDDGAQEDGQEDSKNTETEEIKEITLGKYDQDKLSSNGLDAVEWIILERKDNKALVISKYILDAKQYNTKNKERRWDECTLRVWMNDVLFVNMFSKTEKEAVLTTSVEVRKNPKYKGYAGRYLTDNKLFLLSAEEAEKYFGSNDERICTVTAAAKAKGAYANKEDVGWWWLRSFGSDKSKACFVGVDGAIDYEGRSNVTSDGGIRPVMWVDMEKVEEINAKAK